MVMETEYMLTLIDNPFDYFTDFDRWLMFDIDYSQKHNCPSCCEYLARVADPNLYDDMTEKEKSKVIEEAVDSIILHDYRCLYKKISKEMEVIEPMQIVEPETV